MDLNLKNKQVVVIGGTYGIGFSISKGFLDEGSNVHIVARNSKNKVSNQLKDNYKNQVNFYESDATNFDSLSQTGDEILLNSNDKIDILISNVGNGSVKDDPLYSELEWNNSWNINFNSALNVTRVFSNILTRCRGSMIFISSIAGLEYVGAPISYSTSKMALNSFAKTLSHKLAPHVRVNIIAPGNIWVKDGVWDKKQKNNPKLISKMLNDNIPLKRFGLASEISDLVVFISSEKASFITGSCIVVDGGQTTKY